MRSKLWSTTSSQLSCKSHSREQRPKTLRKHHRDELDTGQVKASAKVAESLFRKAVGDGLRQFSARAPTPSSWALRRLTVTSSHDKNRPKRFCRSMPVGTPVDVSSWRQTDIADRRTDVRNAPESRRSRWS